MSRQARVWLEMFVLIEQKCRFYVEIHLCFETSREIDSECKRLEFAARR